MTVKKHSEGAFEAAIVASLVTDGGLVEGDPKTFDVARALFVDDVLRFVHGTQADVVEKLRPKVAGDFDATLVAWLCKSLDQQGSLDVLRHGFRFFGRTIRVAQFKPAFGLNPKVAADYDANIVKVTRQVHFDPNAPNDSLDLVLSINGVPVATAELKNPMTGQSVADAERQYRHSRDPLAPIFRFKQRALVHFAVDPDLVSMTTRLEKHATAFLPFNRGAGTGAGNPLTDDGEHRTAYLWQDVWQRDSLLELVQRFVHLHVDERTDPKTRKKTITERVVFPRYHQLRAVRRLVAAAAEHGAGTNYLVQHSAGSGKSNSIGWLAHRLQSLHDANDDKVFDCVVVLTDRRVLDRQLQSTISQFDHVDGVVQRIDQNSQQLADSLATGSPIIISTIHKFGFIADKIAALPDRRYAVIVDEAHSSQSGEMADAVRELLSGSDLEAQLQAELDEQDDPTPVDQLALRAALLRGRRPNISYFAFTATPKFKTLKLFGYTDADGKPAPFDLYSMRQAIEEGFILDVLKGYQTWTAYYRLVKKVAEDPELPKREAAAALARFVSLHPHNIAQKTEIIVEHFRAHVLPELGGKAKAMVVTSSRLHATRYKRAFDAYLAEKGYADVACLVAFSGEVRDPDFPEAVTEGSMNPPKLGDIAEALDSSAFNVLIVANKYQTGFDQPKLVAMYVDKKLAGVQAVQTLSRLNRTMPGKTHTFVLDFVNDREDILNSFQPFFEATAIDEDVDPQRLYELSAKLDATRVYVDAEVERFARTFFDPKRKPDDHAQLTTALNPARDRYVALDDDDQDDFKKTASALVNLYSFLGQVITFTDAELEKRYVYVRFLLRLLRQTQSGPPRVRLEDDVALEYYRLQRIAEGDIELQKGANATVSGPTATGTRQAELVLGPLSELLGLFNERFGTEWQPADLLIVEAIKEDLARDPYVSAAARANTEAKFGLAVDRLVEDALVSRHGKNEQFVDKVLSDDAMLRVLSEYVARALYPRLRGAEGAV
ncbi:MAG: type I restriction endonuclease subunit R [Sandaracinus sp.]|nr:type I restriction endonuclease subunit R [Sandaracinus sp.]